MGAMSLPPVVLVPGLTGSALEVRLNNAHMPHFECSSNTDGKWTRAWLAPTMVIPREIDCLIARLTLTYNATSDSYSNLPGVEVRARGFPDDREHDFLYKLEFETMLDHLKADLGYELGKNIFLAPYDWRLAGDAHAHPTNGVVGFYSQLQQLIEKAVSKTSQKVALVSHSLGCPTTLAFLHRFVSEEWRATYIDGWVALSGPWLGSSMQAKAYIGGDTLGVPILSHDYVKPVQVNASSGVWLAPNPMAFGETPIITTPARNYTARDLPHLVSTIGKQAGGLQTVSLLQKLSGDLPSLQAFPSRVHMQNWYSTGVKTAERFEYSKEVTLGFNEAPTKIHYGDGDGTVNIMSLKSVERHWAPEEHSSVVTKVFPGVSHFGMLSDDNVLKALTGYLKSSRFQGNSTGGQNNVTPSVAIIV